MTMEPFNWVCPYCNHAVLIDIYNFEQHEFSFDNKNKHGKHRVVVDVIICPNGKCGEFTLFVNLLPNRESRNKQFWNLIPPSNAKVFPSYIPRAIIQDYEEACLIVDKSPKASATLARRCLQGMIRDFWEVKKGRLVDEIEAIKEKVEPDVWDAIDVVRKVGNIGAHMEKDINVIVEVEPGEAEQLIALIEMLMKEWYIARNERQVRLEEIKKIAVKKEEAKKPAAEAPSAIPLPE